MLLGRDREQRRIEDALGRARHGAGATLVLLGEPGIGKSALLDDAAAQARDMAQMRARGVQSEAQIPFAALLGLLRPALGKLNRLPSTQAAALEAALALRPAGASTERFVVGAATLALLAAHADDGPLLVIIDDAHWLDQPSSEAILFALRRMVGDPVAALIAVRTGTDSPLASSDLPSLVIEGLGIEAARALVPDLPAGVAQRLHEATAGNPLAIQELAGSADDLMLGTGHTPVPVPERIAAAYVSRLAQLDAPVRRILCLLAVTGTEDLFAFARAAAQLGLDTGQLAPAEAAGLIRLAPGDIAFRHPLVRSAIYAASDPAERREAHRTLADTLPDRDFDRRAWHLAAAAIGLDEPASQALEQAGRRSRERSAYATASAAFAQAARLTAEPERAGLLLLNAAETAWHGGQGERASNLLSEARELALPPAGQLSADELGGRIAVRRGPVMEGYRILLAAASAAPAEQAVAILADAAGACFYAASPGAMLEVGHLARATLPDDPSPRTEFLAAAAYGMAEVLGGDAGAGMREIQRAIAIADTSPGLLDDLALLPWLATAPLFLRDSAAGRGLLEPALTNARARSALSTLPFVLNLRARDHATTARWSDAEVGYLEAMALARETEQLTDLSFALSGLAMLYARRGRGSECRNTAAEAVELSRQVGAGLHEIWGIAALGELELGLGNPARGAERFLEQLGLLDALGITDPDLSPVPELVDASLRTGERSRAQAAAQRFIAAAADKGQPWSLARARRCGGLLADDESIDRHFEAALASHAQTADVFETARTQLAYGERLRRARRRRDAREQLRAALEIFDGLEAAPWSERARAELSASGETLRRRDPSTLDELTPQELQIARLLADGATTREAAASLFVSPKTVEYHLRHVYLKLGINSRDALSGALAPHGDPRTPAPAG